MTQRYRLRRYPSKRVAQPLPYCTRTTTRAADQCFSSP